MTDRHSLFPTSHTHSSTGTPLRAAFPIPVGTDGFPTLHTRTIRNKAVLCRLQDLRQALEQAGPPGRDLNALPQKQRPDLVDLRDASLYRQAAYPMDRMYDLLRNLLDSEKTHAGGRWAASQIASASAASFLLEFT